MKAITTRFYGPSNVKGSRIMATDNDGHKIIVSMGAIPDEYDQHTFKEEAHAYVAQQLANKLGWTGYLVQGPIPRGHVHVFLDFKITDLLHEAAQELYALHQHHYSKCLESCPAIDIVSRIEQVTGKGAHPTGQFISRQVSTDKQLPNEQRAQRPYSKTVAIHDAMEGC